MKNKVVLITGGAAGIGKSAAKKFAKHGAKIVLVDVDESVKDFAVHLNENGTEAISFKVDVSNAEQMKSCIEDTIDKFGRIDVLLNNAGIEGDVQPITEYPEDMFDAVINVNVKGVFNGLKYVLPVMVKQGSGSVVNTASVAGLRGFPGLAAYTASKHAVLGLTRVAAAEVAAKGVRVNAVCPGPVDTRMMKDMEEMIGGDNARDDFESNIPLGRYAEAEEIANLMYFLASDESSAIVGAAYTIDGGQTAI